MATFNTPLVTTQGLALLKAEIAGTDSITFTKIVFSSDDYSQSADSTVQALTGLSSLDLTATARSFTDINGNLKIRAVANNQNTTSAFYIKSYGLYGKNNAGNEILIAVSTAQNANFVPAYNGKQTNQIAYTFNIAVSSTQNITLSSSTDVDVTQADLAGINNAVNSNASSLTAQQNSYASSLNSAFSSNNSSMNSAFSANNSNTNSYVSSATNSLTSYVSKNVGDMQSQVSVNSTDISTNATNIANLQLSAASNASAISNNATSTSSAISSVSSSNNAVSNSIASTVSVNQSNIANNSGAISNLQSSVANNSSAISSNASEISSNATAISVINTQVVNAVNTAMTGLRFMGDCPGNYLYQIQTPGIYNLAGKKYTDWGSQLWGNFVVINAGGGVINQFIYNNTNNCWVQTCNSWGNTGFKSIY